MKKIIDKRTIIFLIGYFSLIFGFILNEDMSGGSEHDYRILHENLIESGFEKGVFDFLFNFYVRGQLFHSPVYYVIIYYLQNLLGNDFTRILLLHIFLILPFLYYKTINLKFRKVDFLITFLLIFFLSTSYRSIAIWSGREILTTIFLIVSIFYLLKFNNNLKLINIYASFIFLGLASYISPEIGIISLMYFYNIYKILSIKQIAILLIFNFIIAIPFFLYLYHYLQFERNMSTGLFINFKNNLPFFFSSMLIYTLPFILTNIKEYLNFLLKKILFLISFLIIFFLINHNFEIDIGGGAVNFVLKKLELEYIIFIFSSFGLINLLYILKKDIKYNSFVLCIFMIQTSLNYQFFQKYIELYWIIYFVFFFKNIDIEYFFTNKKFKTYLISLYSLILIGIMIYK